MPFCLAILTTVAFAQDLEYPTEGAKPSKGGVTETKFSLESAYHSYDNLDFRARDESSDQAILDSDDKNAFAYTGLSAEVAHAVDDRLKIDVSVSHRGLWGNDQIGNVNGFGGFLYVTSLAFDWTPNGKAADGEHALMVRLGRQYLSIGATPQGAKDYVYADVIDGVRVDVPLGDAGVIEVIPFSLVSSVGDATANFYDYIGQGKTQIFGFRGAHTTQRAGGILHLDGLADGLDIAAHGFFTHVGASGIDGTGADISYGGLLGNFSDNDWVSNFGVRGEYATGPIAVEGEVAYSAGIDRKELVARDVKTSGLAAGGAFVLDTSDFEAKEGGAKVAVDGWYAQGEQFAGDGLAYNHGYVSLKGHQVGGLVADRFLGWHPSAYVGTSGVDDNQHDSDRKSGTLVVHAGAGYAIADKAELGADVYYMKDTGKSFLDFATLDTLVPVYGYSREEFAAEARLGKTLGEEIDGHVVVHAHEHLDFIASGGVLLPGAFYDIPVARIAGSHEHTELGGQAMAWAWNAGAKVSF